MDLGNNNILKEFIPHWLKDNFRIKIGLFSLAFLLWFLVVTEKAYDHVAEVRLIPTQVKMGKMITNRIPEIALVKFRAKGKEMLKLMYFSTPSLEVNLSTINFNYTFDINPDMVTIPGGVIASAIDVVYPDSIEFLLDDILEKELPVASNIYVKTSPGYTMVGDVKLNPPTVKLIGPKASLIALKKIDSDSIALLDASRNTILNLNLKSVDILGSRIIPPSVEAIVNIEKLGERKISGIPIEVRNNPRNRDVILEPGTVDVAVSGAITVISGLDADDVKATVDFKSYNPRRSNRVPVKVDIKEKADLIEIFPKEVRMIVKRK